MRFTSRHSVWPHSSFCSTRRSGSYRDLDLAIAFLDNAALIFFAPLFLHFCALYPSRQQLFATRRWRAVSLYIPALLLLGFE